MEQQHEEPDGFFIPHHRAFGSTLHFGPFKTIEEAIAWAEEHRPGGPCQIVPMYLTVDWDR